MAKTHLLKCRVTKAQYEQIQCAAHSRGHVQLAPYIRDRLLKDSDFVERKLIQIDQSLKRLLEVSK